MNHHYTHCIDFRDNCPNKCVRAKLVREYERYGNYAVYAFGSVSWGHFYGTAECIKSERRRKRMERKRKWREKRK